MLIFMVLYSERSKYCIEYNSKQKQQYTFNFFSFFFKIWLTQSYNGWLMPMSKKHFCLTAPDKEFDPVTVSICKKPSTNADHYQKWQHTLQEVLALWISGNFHQRYSASHKFKKNRAKVNQVLLYHSNDENDLLFG